MILADTSILMQKRDNRIAVVKQRASISVVIACLFMIAIVASTSLHLRRSISSSLRKLEEGIETIAGGDLNFRVSLENKDELGRFALAFNEMTSRLSTSYASIDDLKQAQEDLRQNREWLKVTLSSIGDAVIAADVSGRITFLNPVASALTGWQSAEAVGQPNQNVLRIFNERTREPAEDIIQAVLADGCIVHMANQSVLVNRAGREIPIEDSAAPIKDSAGKVIGVVIVFHDVTEKRRAQALLRQSEERYRSLFNGMSEGFALHEIVCDQKGAPRDYRFLDINPAFEKQTGLKRENLIGKTVLQVLPDTEPEWISSYGQVALTGEPIHFERFSGSLGRHYEVFAYRPSPGQFACVFFNVTERRRAEEAQRESEEQVRKTLESIGDGFFACDGDWRFVYVNAPAERILGIRREEVLGKNHWEVFPLTLGTRLESEYRRAATGEIRDFENFYEPWGRWFHNRCFPRE